MYLASYGDLIHAFGANPQAGFDHYIDYGLNEGRSTHLFDPVEYLASYQCVLIQAFGLNTAAAEQHYVQYGFNEGRSTHLFDPVEYLASYGDLIQAFGLIPQPQSSTTSSTASTKDARRLEDAIEHCIRCELIAAFGDNPGAGATHYVQYGFFEDVRSTVSMPSNTLQTTLTYRLPSETIPMPGPLTT